MAHKKHNPLVAGLISGFDPDYYKTQGALANLGYSRQETQNAPFTIGYATTRYAIPIGASVLAATMINNLLENPIGAFKFMRKHPKMSRFLYNISRAGKR